VSGGLCWTTKNTKDTKIAGQPLGAMKQRMAENLAGLPVVGTIPLAIGRQIRLHSPFDREIEMGQREFKTTLASCPRQFIGEPWEAWSLRFGWWLKNVVCSGAVPLKMATHHKIYAVDWGLMVEQISVPVQLRKFDIFGDPDSGK